MQIARLQLQALQYLASSFEPVELSPVAPLGTHSSVGGVHQNNVVSTVRMTEVAADPTNQLALEAALRRIGQLEHDRRSRETVRLCAVQRVTRAQVFDDPRMFAHFSILGVVIGGRDLGSRQFEAAALAEVLGALSGLMLEATDLTVQVALSDFDGGFSDVLSQLIDRISSERVTCALDHERDAGRAYYPNVCFKLSVDTGRELVEVGDGGVVGWASALLQNRKERLLIGGLSLERLAAL